MYLYSEVNPIVVDGAYPQVVWIGLQQQSQMLPAQTNIVHLCVQEFTHVVRQLCTQMHGVLEGLSNITPNPGPTNPGVGGPLSGLESRHILPS